MRFAAALAISIVAVGCDRPTPPKPAPVETPATAGTPAAATSEREPIPFIDTHVHMNASAYAVLLQQLEPLGLHRIVNLSGGSTAEVRAHNIEAAAAFGGRVLLFHNIDWSEIDDPEFGRHEAERLEVSVRAGFAGVKISKALGLGVETADGALLKVDDPRLDPIWSKAGELGVPIAIHTSDPKAFFEPPTADNERYAELSLAPSWSFYGDQYPTRDELLAARDRVVARHPETTFILVHLGNNPEDPAYVDNLLSRYPNAFVDVAARVGEFGRHPAPQMREFFTKNADRVLFATDMMMGIVPGPDGRARLKLTLGSISDHPPTMADIEPFYRKHFRYFEEATAEIDHPVPIQGAWKVHPVNLPRPVLDKIYWENAERIITTPWLGREAASDVSSEALRIAGGSRP